jgi:hypothetical protein
MGPVVVIEEAVNTVLIRQRGLCLARFRQLCAKLNFPHNGCEFALNSVSVAYEPKDWGYFQDPRPVVGATLLEQNDEYAIQRRYESGIGGRYERGSTHRVDGDVGACLIRGSDLSGPTIRTQPPRALIPRMQPGSARI